MWEVGFNEICVLDSLQVTMGGIWEVGLMKNLNEMVSLIENEGWFGHI